MAGRSRTKTVSSPPMIPSNSLVASAVRFPGTAGRVFQPAQEWQREAYRHYGICGEARFAANYFGHSMSRATLGVSEPDPANPRELVAAADDSVATKALHKLFMGPDAQAQMLASIGVHLTIAGECYLVGRSATGDRERDRGLEAGQDMWEIISVLEMKQQGEKWLIEYNDGKITYPLSENDVVIRIWRPDPANRLHADSPFKSLLPTLVEIESLTLHIFAQARSRLAGAGLLLVPNEMDFPPPPDDGEGKPLDINNAASLMYSLAEGMLEPIKDQGDPSAVVPLIQTGPAEHIDKMRLMHFWSDLDAAALEMRTSAIHRFALGMDLPPEQILGMGSNAGSGGGTSNGVSHWGAWQIDESTVKLHIEPMLEVVCNAITISYLRPAGAKNAVVTFETTRLRLRPDRSKEALELYDRGLISARVAVHENGFDPVKDMPTPEERRTWLLLKIAGGSATPEQVHMALDALGVGLPPLTDPLAVPRETRPDPTLEDHEQRAEPDQGPSALLAACDALMYRALERAGNRLRRSRGTIGANLGVRAYETHTLIQASNATNALEDAFSCAPEVLADLCDVSVVVPVLEAYARDLVVSQAPHEKARLEKWLTTAAVA